MFDTVISAKVSLGTSGSIFYSSRGYSYCSNGRYYRSAYSSSRICCSCCDNLVSRVSSCFCNLYLLRRRKSVLRGLDPCNCGLLPDFEAERSCFCDKSTEVSAGGRRRRRRRCMIFEPKLERYGYGGGIDEAEIVIGLLTEDIGIESYPLSEKEINGDICKKLQSKRNKVDLDVEDDAKEEKVQQEEKKDLSELEKEELIRAEHKQLMRKDGSCCSCSYSLSSIDDHESDNEIELPEKQYMGESGFSRDSKDDDLVYQESKNNVFDKERKQHEWSTGEEFFRQGKQLSAEECDKSNDHDSNGMLKDDVPIVEEPSEENTSRTTDIIVKRTGRTFWNVMADIFRLRWSSRSGGKNTSGGIGGSSIQSMSSEARLSGHEAEGNEEISRGEERISVAQEHKSNIQQEQKIHSKVEEAYRLEWEQRKIDEMFMREALVEAQKAADSWEVPVGAVLIHNGQIIARGYNQVEQLLDSTAHAEMICIREASKTLGTWRLSGTKLYVTLEPCPMCAGAILQARVDTVVWGAPNKLLGADGSWIRLFPNGDTRGNGLDQTDVPTAPIHPFHPKITIRRGVLASECADSMQQFFKLRRKKKDVKIEPPSPPSCLPIIHHPSKFFAKLHDFFHLLFCL